MEQLGLHIASPPAGEIDPEAVANGLAGLVKLANAVDVEDDDQPPAWALSNLSMGSADCAVRPATGQEVSGTRRMRIVWQGVQQFKTREGIPPCWNEQAVRVLLDLTALTSRRGVEGAALTMSDADPITLDETIRHHAESSIRGAAVSLATVRGTIVRWLNDTGKREVGIREAGTRRAVRVLFPPSMDRELRVALYDDLPVSIQGVLKRNSEGQKVSLVAEQIVVLPASAKQAPRARDMMGVLGKDWTGDMDSVEWARSQRG